MSAIAAEVGGSKATLWGHFGSKDDLFDAFVDNETATFHVETFAVLGHPGEAFAILGSFIEAFIASMSTPAALKLQRQVAGATGRAAAGQMLYDRLISAAETTLAGFFISHMADGTLRRGDPRRTAELVITLCLGSDQQRLFWAIEPPGARTRVRAQTALDLLKEMLRPDGGKRFAADGERK